MTKILSDIKTILNARNLRPKKSLGQNFLVNPKIYGKITTQMELKKGDTIIEIGAGLGTLTDFILKAVGDCGKIIAVEKDDKFSKILTDRFKGNKNVTIINGDILKFNPARYNIKPRAYKTTGNIPYYLTSRLIRIIFENWPQPKLATFMVQKEVAQRITAKPPKMNLLAISAQYFSTLRITVKAGRGDFWPKPKVNSCFIILKPKKSAEIPIESENFFKIVKAGFEGKRKQLLNSLSAGLKEPKEKIKSILDEAGIISTARAETLNINEWGKIAKIYYSRHQRA